MYQNELIVQKKTTCVLNIVSKKQKLYKRSKNCLTCLLFYVVIAIVAHDHVVPADVSDKKKEKKDINSSRTMPKGGVCVFRILSGPLSTLCFEPM